MSLPSIGVRRWRAPNEGHLPFQAGTLPVSLLYRRRGPLVDCVEPCSADDV